ncbi:unnamed protein product, partial [Chrysoparadoxa australica]
INGETIYSVYSFDGTLRYRDNATTGGSVDYLFMGGRAVVRVNRDVAGGPLSTSYIHHDHLGSSASATNSVGNLLWRESYTPFGETLNNPAGNADDTGFTGHIRDTATGLTYAQARYYDPAIGRFLSNDPVGFAEGGWRHFNRYVYAENNPVNKIDLTGEDAFVVSRRTPGNGRHAFIAVTDDDGNTVRQYSYEPQNAGQLRNPGRLVAVGDDPASETARDDAAAWADRDGRDDVTFENLNDLGLEDGDAMNEYLGDRDNPGDVPYQVFPRTMPGRGCNSNCAAAGVAEGARDDSSRQIDIPARTPGWRDPIEPEG